MDETALAAARQHLASGRHAEAAAALEPLCRAWPRHAEAAQALGLALAGLGRDPEALEWLGRAAALAPEDPAAAVNWGAALSRAGRTEEALAAFRRAAELAPALPAARFNLAQELWKARDVEGAAREMRAAAALDPACFRDLARIEGAREDWEAAAAAWRACAAAGLASAEARAGLALALENAGKDTEALAEWRRLVAEGPASTAARNHVVALLARRGEFAEAEEAAREATEADPANADAWHNLGAVRSLRGDAAGAVAAWRRTLLADPSRVESAREAAAALPPPPAEPAEIDHADPFGDAPHRVGVLTFRAHGADDVSRGLAHALPAVLADAAAPAAAVARHVAPFRRGEPRRADVAFDYFDPHSGRMGELTRALRAERWVFGEISEDLATLRVRLWTAGSATEQSATFPLDPRDPAAALRAAAEAAGIPLAAAPPDPRALLHLGLGATSVVDDLALEHLLAALRPAPWPLAESEFLARVLDLLHRGDPAAALPWLDRALSLRPSPRAHFARGQALFAAGRFDPARDAWAAAAALDPSLRPPALPSAWLELRAGRLEEAARLFEQASKSSEDTAAARVGLGCVAAARGDEPAARARFHEALEASPRMPEALFQTALSWWREGNAEEAVRWGGRLEAHHEGHPLVAALARILGRA